MRARESRSWVWAIAVAIVVGTVVVAVATVSITPARATTTPIVASPAPGSVTASATTQISLLGAAARQLKSIVVSGSVTGVHPGKLERYVSEPGASYVMPKAFHAGETVKVEVGAPIVGAPSGIYTFVVGDRLTVAPPGVAAPHTTVAGVAHYASAPNLDPPVVTVTKKDASLGGDLLLTPKGSVGNAGPLIVDSSGNTVWFDPLSGVRAFDLNKQMLGNKQVLTWWQGVVVAGHGVGTDVIMNRAYHQIATITGGNGYQPDLHEFQLEPNGAAFVTSYQALRWNTSSEGGIADGAVWDGIVQEIDVHTGLVMYEWHSLDHVSVALSDLSAPRNASALDYFHVNSIEPLSNGDLLVGARNVSAVYEIDPSTGGSVVWELGGKNSTFTMGPDTTFWFQHDARLLPGNIVSLFDDEAAPAHAATSRGLEIAIDPTTKTATVAHVYDPPSNRLAIALGNTQTLPFGNVVVSWGTTPYVSEFTVSGTLEFDASMPKGDDTYRSYVEPWSAAPTTLPSVVVSAKAADTESVAVSWNGETQVTRWRVLAGASSSSLAIARNVDKAGFETTISLPSTDHDVEVQALNKAGHVIRSSAVVTA